MLLVEEKVYKDKKLFKAIDNMCFKGKNLYNACNYLISQIARISYKLNKAEELEEWEISMLDTVNKAITKYNKSGKKEKGMKLVDKDNGFIANAYFLSWYLKGNKEYKELPLATCSQVIIQELCRNWKTFYRAISSYNKNKINYLGRPQPPRYKHKTKGREWLTLTYQNIKIEKGIIYLPKVFDDFKIKTDKNNIQQVKIKAENRVVRVQIIYKVDDVIKQEDNKRYYSVDLGVNNLITVVSNVDGITPFIVNGRPLKAINQYYNKELARKKSICKKVNKLETTKGLLKLVNRRNKKIKDYMHKTSRLLVNRAVENNISKIVIGKIDGWKQEVNHGKVNNQNFVSIPFEMLIQMIKYKSELKGIEVIEINEGYTSGTSYIDSELPCVENYNKGRRKYRGLFVSNNKEKINADVNAAYQIGRKAGISINYKGKEKVEKIRKVA